MTWKFLCSPVICLYDVYKRFAQLQDASAALTIIGDMLHGRMVDVDGSLALSAAQLSLDLKLVMADSLMLAAARAHSAVLWTQDEHFKDFPDVRYIEKRPRG